MDDIQDTVEVGTKKARRSLPIAGLLAAGAITGIALAGFGVAAAQSTTPPPAANEDERVAPAPGRGRPGRAGGPGHLKGFGRGAIHGEFVVPDADGEGYQTLATQLGDVTAVSATSITVKSVDGFSRTYAVNDDTMVNAGNEGIADVKTGDKVRVMAVVSGDNARAVHIQDTTQAQELRKKWRPARPDKPRATPSATPTA